VAIAWALVIAGKGGRRSHVARDVAGALAARGLRVGGFTQRMVESESGTKTIDLVHVPDGKAVPLARTAPSTAEAAAACTLAFDRAAFEEARRWIEADAPASDVLVLDGIGKLELAGEGNRAAVAHALATRRLVVLAVRDDQLVYAIEALGLDEPVAAYTDGSGPAALERFVGEVASAVRRRIGAA
jgi:nucleoside-triphosphatase THEP1